MNAVGGKVASILTGIATAVVIVAIAMLPFLTPQWVAFEQGRAQATAWTGYTTPQLRAATDAILSDLSMPQMDGFEFVEALKQNPETRNIPVSMFSSSGLLYDRERALAVGCEAFYPKPATLAGLAEVLLAIANFGSHASVK